MAHETIAYTQESSYGEAPDAPTYETAGGDVQVSELSLDNAVQRIRNPGAADPIDTVFHQFEGALSVTGTIYTGNTSWLQNVFGNATTPYEFQTGAAQSARWFLGVDPSAGTAEREAMGVIFPQCTITCEQDSEVTFELTGVYADEQQNATLTQGAPIEPTGDPLVFHGGDLAIPSASSLVLMDSATLTLNSQARTLRGWSRHPIDAVMGGHESQIEFSRIYRESDSVTDLAYGSTGASAPAKYPDTGVNGTLSFGSPNGGTMTINLDGITASDYDWPNAGNVNENMMENTTFYINSPSISPPSVGT